MVTKYGSSHKVDIAEIKKEASPLMLKLCVHNFSFTVAIYG